MNNVLSKEYIEKYVRESNRIENITVKRNQRLFIDHTLAVNYVIDKAVNGEMAMPEEIHKILMKRVTKKYSVPFVPGELRTIFVRVGPYLKPSAEIVPLLLEKWNKNVERFLKTAKAITPEERGIISWHYHDWFEGIHPFLDGNGRTGRILLNNIRLLVGLPWITIPSSEKWKYFNKIHEWEENHPELLIIDR